MNRNPSLSLCLVLALTLILAMVGVWSVLDKRAAARARGFAVRETRLEAAFTELREALADVPEERRIVVLEQWRMPPRARLPRARFAWRPGKGIVWERGLEPVVHAPVSQWRHFSDWAASGKRVGRRGVALVPKTPFNLFWVRVGDTLYALVFNGNPIPVEPLSPVWPVLSIVIIAAGGLLGLGGWRLYREARRAREEDLQKTTFLSMASHELKTPLQAIGIWAELLQAGKVPAGKLAQAYDYILQDNRRLTRLVENMLDYTRLERHRRVYAMGRMDLRTLVRSVTEGLVPSFEAQRVALPPEVGEAIWACADEDAVRQILVNLLTNAHKYAPEGPIEIGYALQSGQALVTVADHGPGIPPEARRHVFERFYRVEDAERKAVPGLGLGLAISRALAREMEGDLTVSPRPGGGTVFTLALPLSIEQRNG